jgi:glycosyltransferase involved in cell wall biosynthesis
VRSLLPSCEIALHASAGEAFSLAILEFMAAGLPCVAPEHCGNGEAIEHEVSGVLYPPASLSDAVAWLAHLLDDSELRRAMGVAARERAEANFTLDRMLGEFSHTVSPYLQT